MGIKKGLGTLGYSLGFSGVIGFSIGTTSGSGDDGKLLYMENTYIIKNINLYFNKII